MKAEIAQKINAEIINKITSTLYAFSYGDDEEPSDESILILRIEKTKVTVELQMEVEKNLDGIINNCKISTSIQEENFKRKRIDNANE